MDAHPEEAPVHVPRHVRRRGFDAEQVREPAAVQVLAVRRSGFADSTDVHRKDDSALVRQPLEDAEFHPVLFLAGFRGVAG